MCLSAGPQRRAIHDSNKPKNANKASGESRRGEALGGFNIPERSVVEVGQRETPEKKRMICCRGEKDSGGLRD